MAAQSSGPAETQSQRQSAVNMQSAHQTINSDDLSRSGTMADRVEVIIDADGLVRLEAEWRRLETLASETPYFASFDWCLSWWNWFGAKSERELSIFVVRRDGEVQAIVPFTVARSVLFASARPMGDETGQYADCLVHPDRRGDAVLAETVHGALKTLKIDRITLTNCREDAAIIELLEPVRRGKRWIRAGEYANVEVRPADFDGLEGYMKSRSSSLRKGLRRRRRNLAELGDVRHERISDAAELAYVADRILELKLEWLGDNGLHGRFLARDGVSGWMNEMMRRAMADGKLHMSVIRCGKRICAAQVAFQSDTRLTGYFSAFDISLSRYAVGKLHLEDHIVEIFKRNLVLDLMPPSDSYKCEWGVERMKVAAYTVPVTPLGAAVSMVYSVRTRAAAKSAYLRLPSAMRAGFASSALEAVRRLRGLVARSGASTEAPRATPILANAQKD